LFDARYNKLAAPKISKDIGQAEIKLLSGEQRRQLIDTQQVFEAWRAAKSDDRRRFTGGMRWGTRDEKTYLLQKIGKSEKSLGLRNQETEAIYKAFTCGQVKNADRLAGLSARLDWLARINVAMNLGRVPCAAGRILRAYDEKGLLDKRVVVGTHCLFAYEAHVGVQFNSGLMADDGYLVDPTRPETKKIFCDLSWLTATPRLEATAIDKKGYPLRLIVIDPRVFALHKAWLSEQEGRTPLQAARDLDQAKAVATIATRYLRKNFDSPDLSALPKKLAAMSHYLLL
jgi:hypothetical protein